MIGAEQAATAPNDGYHLLFTVKGVMAIVPHVYPSAKFKPLKDFKAVTEILQVPHIIVATNSAPFNDMKGMMEYAGKNPGKLNYASNGVGSHPHVGMETIAGNLGIKITHVPYKGVPTVDLMAGVVDTPANRGVDDVASQHQGRQDQGARHFGIGANSSASEPADPDRNSARISIS